MTESYVLQKETAFLSKEKNESHISGKAGDIILGSFESSSIDIILVRLESKKGSKIVASRDILDDTELLKKIN